MKKKIKVLFTTNLALKIGAVFLAFLLWLVISNTQDSIRTKNVKIDIMYINQDLLEKQGVTVTQKPQSVTIPIQIRRSKYEQVSGDDFTAVADLTVRNGNDLSNQQVMFQITLNDEDNAWIESWDYPKDGRWITVVMDELQTKEMEVELKKIGALSDTYKLNGSGLIVEPAAVTVTGPKNEFSNLTSVRAEVDLSLLTPENNQVKVTLGFYDANDTLFASDSLKLSQETVIVSAGVLRVKEVSLNFEGTVGTPAAGHGFSELKSSTDSVVLEGLKASLADVSNITIPKEALDVAGLSSTVTRKIDITPYLPPDTSLSSDNRIVEVTLYIEELKEKSYSISNQNIQLNGKQAGYGYTLSSGNTNVKLKGFQEDLTSLDENSISLSTDVTGLGEGSYRLNVLAEVKQGFTLVGNPTVTVQIKKSNFEQTNDSSVEQTSSDESNNAAPSASSAAEAPPAATVSPAVPQTPAAAAPSADVTAVSPE